MTESSILKKTLIKIGAHVKARFARLNAGKAWAGKAIKLRAGQQITAQHGDVLIKHAYPIRLGPSGMADIMGIAAITITPDMVGQVIGQVIALEGKTATGKQRKAQKSFEVMIKKMGGEYHIFRSPEEALAIINRITKV